MEEITGTNYEKLVIDPILLIIKENQKYLTKKKNLPQLAKLGFIYDSLFHAGRVCWGYEGILAKHNQCEENPKYKLEECQPETPKIDDLIYDAWGMHCDYDNKEELLSMENLMIEDLNPEYNVMKNVYSHIGVKRTEETKKNISNSLKGKKLSPEHVEKIRINTTGKKQSLETIAKRIKNSYKPVSATNKKDQSIILTFESATHAAKELNIKVTCIYEVIHLRKKSYKGYIWKQIKN